MNSLKSVDWAIFFFKSFFIFCFLWGFSHWQSEKIPRTLSGNQKLNNEPYQQEINTQAFDRTVKGQNYQIQPTHDYEIWGLVVSGHDSSSWKDYVHESWKDFINTKDICVIWGKNILNPYLSELSFSNGSWTCYVQTKSSQAWSHFDMNQISNNHLIPANLEIQKLIARARVGDEIRIKGQLVNYSINKGPARKTSTIRTDTDNGACEIIYVTEFETLKRHNNFWIIVSSVAKVLTLLSLVAMLFCILVWPFLFSTGD